MRNYAIIIPALNPTESLVDYVKALDFSQTIVVNDGSKEGLSYIFSELDSIENCIVLTHPNNQGKGRALKTAFKYVLENYPDLDGVITADADGQHTLEDVLKVANAFENCGTGIVLGVRDFSNTLVPKRSYVGNRITSFIFRLFYGKYLKDTQTGLRGISINEIPAILALKGERYEYEMNMLIYFAKNNSHIGEVSIQTVYFNNNKGSYYHPIWDSIKIFIRLALGVFMKVNRRKQ